MTALSTTTHKILVSTGGLEGAVPLHMHVALARQMLDMGLLEITIANTAPVDKKVLWWHKDARQLKRFNALTASWAVVTGNQFAMHLLQRAMTSAQVDTGVETGDLFGFYDVSLGEWKLITRENLLAMLGGSVPVITSSPTEFIIDLTQLESDVHYHFYGVMKWTSGIIDDESEYIIMRIRTSSNANLNFLNFRYSPIGTVSTSSLTFSPLQDGAMGTPAAVPVSFGIVKHGAPARVSLAGVGRGGAGSAAMEIQSTNSGSAAAKLHFTLPANTYMNGKVIRP